MPEEYDGPGSGGIATEDMANLPDVLIGALMPIIKEYYRNLFLEREAHAKTLKVFQAALDGGLPEGRLIVNSDGWQIKAERPSTPDVEEKPRSLLLFLCDFCGEPIPVGQEIIPMPGAYYHPEHSPLEINANGAQSALEALKPAH